MWAGRFGSEMTRAFVSILLPLAASGCGDFPRDVEGTLDRITETGTIRVGVVDAPPDEWAKTRDLIMRLEQSTKASAALVSGASEPLLLQLEDGTLDLVVAPFDSKSPWSKRVTLGPPIATAADLDPPYHLIPATQNGENGWTMRVHVAAKQIAEPR